MSADAAAHGITRAACWWSPRCAWSARPCGAPCPTPTCCAAAWARRVRAPPRLSCAASPADAVAVVGFCGAVRRGLRAGDIVVASEVRRTEQGVVACSSGPLVGGSCRARARAGPRRTDRLARARSARRRARLLAATGRAGGRHGVGLAAPGAAGGPCGAARRARHSGARARHGRWRRSPATRRRLARTASRARPRCRAGRRRRAGAHCCWLGRGRSAPGSTARHRDRRAGPRALRRAGLRAQADRAQRRTSPTTSQRRGAVFVDDVDEVPQGALCGLFGARGRLRSCASGRWRAACGSSTRPVRS